MKPQWDLVFSKQMYLKAEKNPRLPEARSPQRSWPINTTNSREHSIPGHQSLLTDKSSPARKVAGNVCDLNATQNLLTERREGEENTKWKGSKPHNLKIHLPPKKALLFRRQPQLCVQHLIWPAKLYLKGCYLLNEDISLRRQYLTPIKIFSSCFPCLTKHTYFLHMNKHAYEWQSYSYPRNRFCNTTRPTCLCVAMSPSWHDVCPI